MSLALFRQDTLISYFNILSLVGSTRSILSNRNKADIYVGSGAAKRYSVAPAFQTGAAGTAAAAPAPTAMCSLSFFGCTCI